VDHSRNAGPATITATASRRRWRGPARLRGSIRKPFTVAAVAALAISGATVAASQAQSAVLPFEVQSLDGSGNNAARPTQGQVGTNYSRLVPARYADGIGSFVPSPPIRRISNRVFNDTHQNLFSERSVTQWGFAWGQFLDHTFGLRQAPGVGDAPDPSSANIPFDNADALEEFENDFGEIPFTRSSFAAGTGVTSPREQVNTVSSYIDAWAVYGGTEERLEFMREGPVDGNLANNSARLLLPDNFLPRRDTRGNADSAPAMDIDGRLRAQPQRAAVAGDVRANENIALQGTHTLFAREHNRIVGLLPSSLTEQEKFEIARRVVIAEQQYITYNEFLPALGVRLPAYAGYKPSVDTTLSNEFATVGYRAHSMIHGEIEAVTDADRYSAAQRAALEALGIELVPEGDELEVIIPLNVGFFNPDLVELLELGPLMQALGLEPQYKNDEQIDNQLRSVLFEIPVSGNPECLDGEGLPQCFQNVVDLGAIDIERGRDHGMPSYNQLRQAYGLAPRTSFTAITGESTDRFPAGLGVDNPASLEFAQLFDVDGNAIDLADEDAVEGDATEGVRRTTLAARLRAIYGSVNNMDAFTGMLSEPHVDGADFGELQRAIWTREFRNLRDGDRFFYGNNPGLSAIQQQYGISYRRSLAQVIADNTDIPLSEMNDNVFLAADEEPTTCEVEYFVNGEWNGLFQTRVRVTNTGDTTIRGWQLRFGFPTGQRVRESWNVPLTQSGSDVTMSVVAQNWPGTLAPGATAEGWFNATWDNATNARPTHFTLNGNRCTRG
jgi:hypothetical protein